MPQIAQIFTDSIFPLKKGASGIFQISIIFIVITLMYSCEKKPFNYRNKYIGNWEFTTNITEVNLHGEGSIVENTVAYLGLISYDSKEQLKINFLDNMEVYVEVDKNGIISAYKDLGNGVFTSKKIMEYSLKRGGLGAWINYKISGIKK